MTLQAAYSTVSAASIASFVEERYALGPMTVCRLFQRGFNDTYELDGADGRRRMARLSNLRFRGPANVAYETALLTHLSRSGIVVGVPVADRDGQAWSMTEAPEGPRELIVFERLTGREAFLAMHRPGKPDDGSLADFRALGASLAQLHLASDSFRGPPSLYRLEAPYLLNEPLLQVLAVVDRSDADEARALGESLAERLAACATSLSVGHCHGDNHAGNNLVSDAADGTPVVGWFDFDEAGPGYLAYDFATLLWQLLASTRSVQLDENKRALWSAFLAGYAEVRPVYEADLEAIGALVPIRHMLWLGNYASRLAVNGSRVLMSDWFRRELQLARKWGEASIT